MFNRITSAERSVTTMMNQGDTAGSKIIFIFFLVSANGLTTNEQITY